MKVFNRGVDINVSNEDALKVNGTKIIDKDGKIYGDIHAAAGSIGTAELADGGVTTDKIAAGAVETTKIKDSNVNLAKLATGIKPSHIVKFFVDGSTITGTTLVGLEEGDLIVTITATGAASVATCSADDTLPDNPEDTDYLIVFRAVS
ncbi:MAG: hypothetical protein GX663_10950 [Clostridiales bacterium]|nr:hypothetical protein [Clostridiales bacterium]